MSFDPATRLFQDLARRLTSKQVAIRDTNFRSKIGALDVHVRRVLVLEEHQELEAAKPPDLRHLRSRNRLPYRAIFALVQAGHSWLQPSGALRENLVAERAAAHE